jgi:hydroxymethylpyrimidine pyrophosphatase-like HAD family hydrolase
MIFTVDFDGTLCKHEYPKIGEPNQKMINFCKEIKKEGHKLILWTCRRDEPLQEAVQWCNEKGIFFDAVNENLPEIIEMFGGDCRKICADYYIDDRNLTVNAICNLDYISG